MKMLLRCALVSMLAACSAEEPSDHAAKGEINASPTAVPSPMGTALERIPGFAEIPRAKREGLLRLVAQPTNKYSKAARRDLGALIETPGFAALAAAEQAKRIMETVLAPTDFSQPLGADDLFVGVAPKWAQAIRFTTTTYEGKSYPKELGAPPARKAYRLGAPRVGHRLAVAPPRSSERLAKKFAALLAGSNAEGTIGADDYDLTGEEGALFDLEIDGQKIVIGAPLDASGAPSDATSDYRSTEPGPAGSEVGLISHSVDAVARALADVPDANRRLFTTEGSVPEQVDIVSRRNPLDAMFASLYPGSDMRAYMLAVTFPLGNFAVFPKVAEPNQPSAGPVDHNTIVHESGHIWTLRTWGMDPTSKGWVAWRKAMEDDGIAISAYATQSFLEDSAETVLAFCIARALGAADPLGAELAAIIPNRWAILEAQFPK